MENEFVKITSSSEYTDSCPLEYKKYFQLHIFSYSRIISTYYLKSSFKFSDVKNNADRVLNIIQKRTQLSKEVSLFENNSILLISVSKKLIDYLDLFEFDLERGCYEYNDSGMDFFEFIGKIPADVFIKNALTTVGAESLYPTVEPIVQDILKEQVRTAKRFDEMRMQDKTAPKYLVEIYKIEKNYIPVKSHEFLCGSMESAESMPEIRNLLYGDDRKTCIIKEIATGKIVEGNLSEAIESLKYEKWQRKNPTMFDAEAMRRMELDNDDPDFLSLDDYVTNDDEIEEGDDEYEPR